MKKYLVDLYDVNTPDMPKVLFAIAERLERIAELIEEMSIGALVIADKVDR